MPTKRETPKSNPVRLDRSDAPDGAATPVAFYVLLGALAAALLYMIGMALSI